MDSARQLIRWGLPGWVAILFFGVFYVNTLVISKYDLVWFYKLFIGVNEILLLLAVLSIPIGYVFYQIYYWLYWYVPIPLIIGRLAINPVDRGKYILTGVIGRVDFVNLFMTQLEETESDKKYPAYTDRGLLSVKSKEIMEKFRVNWQLADTVWYYSLSKGNLKNVSQFLERRNQFLGDIYHSLGASYTALTIAFFGYCTTLPLVLDVVNVTLVWLSAIVNLILYVFIFAIFRHGRQASFNALLALKHDVITYSLLNQVNST